VPQPPDLPELSDQAADAYRLILDGAPVPTETPGLAELLTMGLAVHSRSGGDRYSAIEPQFPAMDMIDKVHQHLVSCAANGESKYVDCFYVAPGSPCC
jgi:hypothetical protein